MKIKIKNKEIELQYCMRMYLKYEQRTGKSISFEGMSSYTGIIELLYCAIAATLEHKKYRKLGLSLTWEEFLDWTDEQTQTKLLEEFNHWLVDVMQSQQDSATVNDDTENNETQHDPN